MDWIFYPITSRLEWLTRYLAARLDDFERRFMASIDELNASLDRLTAEVDQTAAEVKGLRDDIAALQGQIGNAAALEAAITATTARASALADRLDTLQTHPAPDAPTQ